MQAIGFMAPATMAQDCILVRNLTSDFRVDWALLPFSTRNLSLQGIQYSQAKSLLQNALVMGMDPSDGLSMQFVSSTQVDAHPGGGGSWVLPCLCRTSPSVDLRALIIFGVPDPNTLVGSRLHQMRLMHPT